MTSTNGQHSQQQQQQPGYNIATASSPASATAAAAAPTTNTSPTTAPGIVDSTSSHTTATSGATATVTSQTVIGSQPTSTTLTSDPSTAFHHHNQEFRQVCFNQSIVASSGLAAATATATNNTATATTNNTSSIKRNSPTSNDSSKRIRLDTTNNNANPILTSTKPPKFVRKYRSRSLPIISFNTSSAFYPHLRQKKHHHHHHNQQQQQQQHNHNQDQNQNIFNTNSTFASSHSSVNNTSFMSNTAASSSSNTIPSLPPINLQSLKEIDLHEILKNPQLRHDILFDPQLQFRPNLDGERGKRKKSIIDKYWLEVRKECQGFFNQKVKPEEIKIHRLPILFTTLRDILLSLLPTKDRQQVSEIMDIELLVQQLKHGSFDFVEMSQWLGDVFKLHCAPMRDQWVVEMIEKFVDAYNYNNVSYLVNGLRMIFQILEAMKLDVANHQIRILRPVLIETAVDFERDYFQTLINHSKINIHDSLNWFYKNFVKKFDSIQQQQQQPSGGAIESPAKKLSTLHQDAINNTNLKPIIISSVIDLLSCRQMASEFPSTLAFDHTRLVLLRADARQLVCIQLCVVLYKQLVINAKVSTNLLSAKNIAKVQQEILAIVTDDNGNIKWTKNISAISLQLVKNLYPNESNINVSDPSIKSLVQFSHNWLMKHMQPNSQVYGLMEIKVFKELLAEISVLVENDDLISDNSNITINSNVTSTTTTNTATNTSTSSTTSTTSNSNELKNIATRIATLVKFHWNVFGGYYIDYIKSQRSKLQQEQDNSTMLPTMIEDGDDSNDVSSKKKNDDNKANNTNPTSHRGGENNSNIDNTTSAPLSMLS